MSFGNKLLQYFTRKPMVNYYFSVKIISILVTKKCSKGKGLQRFFLKYFEVINSAVLNINGEAPKKLQ